MVHYTLSRPNALLGKRLCIGKIFTIRVLKNPLWTVQRKYIQELIFTVNNNLISEEIPFPKPNGVFTQSDLEKLSHIVEFLEVHRAEVARNTLWEEGSTVTFILPRKLQEAHGM